jgi:tetratricopeptide (TPR) repeat protein
VQRRYGLLRAIAFAIVIVSVACFGAIQLGSDALNARAAVPGTLPSRVPRSFGLAVYHLLDRVAPAPYVESTLAEQALQSGDPVLARSYALRLPSSPVRDELLARAWLAMGDGALAFEYFLAAPDAQAVDRTVDAIARRDPAEAYRLERLLEVRLAMLQTHPDLVAETQWRMGLLAGREAERFSHRSSAWRAWQERAMRSFASAVALAPLSDKYLLTAANEAMLLGQVDRARDYFAQALQADPASADATAGLGVVAYARGDRDDAVRYLERARALDPQAGMVRALERDLGAAP